jgi:uncharacterized protein DUF1707
MAARPEDGTAGGLGRLRTARADREQAIDLLKAAFVQGRLTKDEFELRVGQVLASRTHADLGALTADIPGWVASARPSDEDARDPGRMLSFRTAARVGAVGAAPAMASAAVAMTQASGVPAAVGVVLVGLTGLSVAVLLAVLLMVLSWVARRSQHRTALGPPSGPGGLASGRPVPSRRLPAERHDRRHIAEAARSRRPRMRVVGVFT